MKKAVMALAIATGMSMAGCTGTKAQTTATDAQGKELPKVYSLRRLLLKTSSRSIMHLVVRPKARMWR